MLPYSYLMFVGASYVHSWQRRYLGYADKLLLELGIHNTEGNLIRFIKTRMQ